MRNERKLSSIVVYWIMLERYMIAYDPWPADFLCEAITVHCHSDHKVNGLFVNTTALLVSPSRRSKRGNWSSNFIKFLLQPLLTAFYLKAFASGSAAPSRKEAQRTKSTLTPYRYLEAWYINAQTAVSRCTTWNSMHWVKAGRPRHRSDAVQVDLNRARNTLNVRVYGPLQNSYKQLAMARQNRSDVSVQKNGPPFKTTTHPAFLTAVSYGLRVVTVLFQLNPSQTNSLGPLCLSIYGYLRFCRLDIRASIIGLVLTWRQLKLFHARGRYVAR